MFPTKLCGVLVFRSVPRVDLLLPHFHTSTQLCHIQIVTHNCVTHTQILSHTNCHTTLSHTNCHTQLCQTQLCHIQLCHTQIVTHNFVNTQLCQTQLCHIQLCHTHTTLSHTQLCHIQLCHTQIVTHNFVNTQLCQTQLCHIQLCHCHTHTTLSHTTLSHTTLSHTNCHTQLCRTQLLRGRRGSWRHLLSFRVAGVALGDMPSFYVAGVVLMGLGCWCLDVFGGPGSGKKMLKFQDAFWRSILDTFWRLFTVFYSYFTMFLCLWHEKTSSCHMLKTT